MKPQLVSALLLVFSTNVICSETYSEFSEGLSPQDLPLEQNRHHPDPAAWLSHEDHGSSKYLEAPLIWKVIILPGEVPQLYAEHETQTCSNGISSLDLSYFAPYRPTPFKSRLVKHLKTKDPPLWPLLLPLDLHEEPGFHSIEADNAGDEDDLDKSAFIEYTGGQELEDDSGGDLSVIHNRRGILNKARKCIDKACAQIALLKKDALGTKNKQEMKDEMRERIKGSNTNLPVSFGPGIKSSTNIPEAAYKNIAKNSQGSQSSWNPSRSYQRIFGDKQTSRTSKESRKRTEDRHSLPHNNADFTHHTGNFKDPTELIWPGNTKRVWDWIPPAGDHFNVRGKRLPSMQSIHSIEHQNSLSSTSSDSAANSQRDKLKVGPQTFAQAHRQGSFYKPKVL